MLLLIPCSLGFFTSKKSQIRPHSRKETLWLIVEIELLMRFAHQMRSLSTTEDAISASSFSLRSTDEWRVDAVAYLTSTAWLQEWPVQRRTRIWWNLNLTWYLKYYIILKISAATKQRHFGSPKCCGLRIDADIFQSFIRCKICSIYFFKALSGFELYSRITVVIALPTETLSVVPNI